MVKLSFKVWLKFSFNKGYKGHPPSANLIYWEEDSISPSTIFVAAIQSKLRTQNLHIPFYVF